MRYRAYVVVNFFRKDEYGRYRFNCSNPVHLHELSRVLAAAIVIYALASCTCDDVAECHVDNKQDDRLE